MYKLHPFEQSVIRLADFATIPNDEANPDWIAYTAWVAQGDTPAPAFTPEELLVQASEKAAEEGRVQARAADISAALPDWATVVARFDQGTAALANATTIAAVKAVLQGLIDVNRKLARVVYWLAKDRAD
jgi:hypothetical protein